MPLSRDDIMTLQEAVRLYRLEHAALTLLRTQLEGNELRHLGWQDDRGWFYKKTDIIEALGEIEMPGPGPAHYRVA